MGCEQSNSTSDTEDRTSRPSVHRGHERNRDHQGGDGRSDRHANARQDHGGDGRKHDRRDDNKHPERGTHRFDNRVADDAPSHEEDQHANGAVKTRRSKAADSNSIDLDPFMNELIAAEIIQKGIPLEKMVKLYPQLPDIDEEPEPRDDNATFMIERWNNDPRRKEEEPKTINAGMKFHDQWDNSHVHMPCSEHYILKKGKQPQWPQICQYINDLKEKCKTGSADFEDLKETMEKCSRRSLDLASLEKLINHVYRQNERTQFMSMILPRICRFVLKLDEVFTEPPPLLNIGSNRSVTMSQRQAASLLACSFFCLFPFRSEHDRSAAYDRYPDPNFERLFQKGPAQKVEKIRCILHYFQRVSESMPIGVLTFRRFALRKDQYPRWKESRKELTSLHMTTGQKIEDLQDTLQVDFANKYIGGGVLGSGCVQEEIRFTICPEMLVSLLLCEVMEDDECIFLTGCERYSTYKGYAHTFEFAGDYRDRTNKDSLGRKRCNLAAMDAIFFRKPAKQYEMESIDRESIKAYASFRRSDTMRELEYAVATGNWGCGAFNGDKQLKSMIQLMAASEAERSLIYAAFGDKHLVTDFSEVYDYLKNEKATVRDLYCYLYQYSQKQPQESLFDYIRHKPVSSLRH